jgi:outer membrane protein assembly factor BamB
MTMKYFLHFAPELALTKAFGRLRAFVPSALALIAPLLLSAPAASAVDPPTVPARVLWVYESQDQYLCSPSVAGDNVIAPGIGAFNTPTIVALKADPAANPRLAWTKSPPFLKRPVVCPPAVLGDLLVFGDGMHQTDGATLRCLKLDGTPVWQLPVPGRLVHLEGSPVIFAGKVYASGGNAGVICVDLNRLTLDGKDTTSEQVQAENALLWAAKMRKYEEEKLKDPDFAIPPTDDDLKKPEPRRIWQVGHGQAGQPQWHVDSELNLTGDNLLVASSFLDTERLGDRAVFCLDASTGQTRWRSPLTFNPWAGATPVGTLILCGSSSIRFDPLEIPKAQGEVSALKLADGSVVWKKALPGGVLSAVAVSADLAVFTATDGKVRCWAIADGAQKWVYDAGGPFFAGAAISGQTVYTASLRGVVAALNLADGRLLWKIDLATDPAVKAPGMIYGTPAVHDGRVYVATSNLDAPPDTPAKMVVVCIGEK